MGKTPETRDAFVMDPREYRAAKEHLALLELLLAALERRHEVMDVVWEARDKEQASERLRELFVIADGADPTVILDMPIHRLTAAERNVIHDNVTHLRKVLGRP